MGLKLRIEEYDTVELEESAQGIKGESVQTQKPTMYDGKQAMEQMEKKSIVCEGLAHLLLVIGNCRFSFTTCAGFEGCLYTSYFLYGGIYCYPVSEAQGSRRK